MNGILSNTERFIVQNNASTNLLLAIAESLKMVKDLRDKNISHGDSRTEISYP